MNIAVGSTNPVKLTAGLILRHETFAVAVAYALAPFVAPGFYADSPT